MKKIKLGYAPTRRSIFSAPAAVEYANYTREKLTQMGVDYVDIDDIAEDGLLHDDADRIKIAEKFKAEKPDIVFLDIVMPQKDGISAVSEICRIDPDAYIIIVSSVGTQTQLRNAIEAGARDFIQKPLNTDQIKSILSVKFEGR